MTKKIMLEFQAVNKKFDAGKQNEVHAVRDANFTVYEGEMVAMMGPSGSGKSTMLNLVGGLTPATDGKIFINGDDVVQYSSEKMAQLRRESIGFIFQHFNLIEFLTAEQNVYLPLLIQGMSNNQARRQATLLLRELGLGGRLGHFPAELSGGQEQRVAIARSMITQPALILGDEPTGDLDTDSANDVMTMFRRINKEKNQTLLLVTHSEDIGALCDRTIRIDDGTIVSTGLKEN